MKLGVVLLVGVGVFSCAAAQDWWQSAIFYQIYPRSFRDTNGDGVGDIKGVTERLAHLKELGATATWLSPIMKSPQADFGYDISDFKDIDPLFGTMADFEAMMARAKELDIKVIMDFVPNHSSDEHDWFKKSVAREPGYEDYYVWKDGKNCQPKPWQRPNVPCEPPNNWVSVFYGRAWTWNWDREQFYLHQFDKGQPDLNYNNPVVVEEMKEVLRFWLDKGASGFRVDAINHLFEIADFRDEPLTGWTSDPNDYGYTHHVYTKDLDETYAMVKTWRQFLNEYTATRGTETKIILTEAYANDSATIRFYYDADAHFPFNFGFIERLNGDDNAYRFRDVIEGWVNTMPPGATANWVLGNHDKPRVASRYGPDRHDVLLTMQMTLPGVAVTYNGEEIGMVDHRDISWEETVDPQACNGPREGFEWRSRDPQRTPMQWDDSTYAGFTDRLNTGSKLWLPLHPNFRFNNLKRQKEAARSYFSYFKDLAELRQNPILKLGSFRTYIFNDDIYSHIRTYQGSDLITVVNLSNRWSTIDLSRAIPNIGLEVRILAVSHMSAYSKGEILMARNMLIRSYDAMVVQAV